MFVYQSLLKGVCAWVCAGEMERNRERVQQQGDGGGGKQATTSLPGKSEKGQERDQAGVEDDNSQKQVRHTAPQVEMNLKQ